MALRHALTPGTRIRQYEIKTVIGQGGFGITYLAYDHDLDRDVAIKECYPRDFVEREGTFVVATSAREKTDFSWALDKFVDEATTLAKFKHPGIVQVLQIIKEENGTAYIVLEFVEGESLTGWLERLGRVPSQAELQEIIKPIFDALEAVHEKNYAHRDIAPDNIFIRPNGSAVLLDFGAAKQIIGQYSRTMNLIVKDGYSAPEQYYTEGKQGPWTDVYALSATLYRIISGARPIDAMARQDAVTNDEADPLPDLNQLEIDGYSKAFLDSVMSGMTIKIKDRPQSLEALRNKVLSVSDQANGISKQTNGTSENDAGKSNGKIGKYLVAAAVVIGLTVGGGYYYFQYLEQEKRLAEQARLAAELAAWTGAKQNDSRRGYETFISNWPQSEHVPLARASIENLSKTWTKVIGDEASQKATAVSTNEDVAVVAGWTSSGADIQAIVQMYSHSGKQKWQAEFGDKGNDIIEDVLLRGDNSVLVTGHNRVSPSKPQTGFVISFSPNGKKEWQKTFEDEKLVPAKLALLPNGNTIVAGTKQHASGLLGGWIAEFNRNGNVTDQADVQNTQNHEIHDILVLPDGNLAIVGNIIRDGREDKNFWFARIDKSGEIITERKAGGPKYDSYNAIALFDDGQLVTVGESRSFSTDNLDAIAVRVRNDNRMIPKPILLAKDDQLLDVATSGSGEVFLTGVTSSIGSGHSDGWLMKYDQQLKTLFWQRTIGDDGWDDISGISVMNDGTVLAVGSTDSVGAGSSDILIVRFDKDGNYKALPN